MVIRTLRDYDNDSAAAPVPPQWQQSSSQSTNRGGTFVDLNSMESQQQQQPQQQSSSSSFMQQPSPDTSESSFWSYNLQGESIQWYHMVLMCCCPCFVGPMCSDVRKSDYKVMLRCFLFWITIVDLIYFLVEICVGGVTNASDNSSLGPPTSTLILLGAKYVPKIKYQYQVWRFVVPIIMHAGFIHLFFNLYVQFMICMAYERRWGALRTSLIYVMAGVGGNLLSSCALPLTVSVGASGAIMGIIGARVGDVACRWPKMSQPGRISNSINIAIMLLFIVMMSFFGSNVDWASHLGGFLVGLVLSPLVFSHEIERKSIRIVSMTLGAGLTFIFYLATILIFTLAVKVDPPK